ncbi:Laccase-14 [Vitis vinifera]|uniref:laccase n=1 Tax=Vitis vinifera TaxID=29760 RepID=A0A438CUE2_VITVI|nr:Laccase-14 [Vitis vinifera]
MWLIMKVFLLQILAFLLFGGGIHCQASTRRLTFVVKEASYTRLCSTKNILTISMDRWSEYITQCPIQPGSKFSQKIILSSEEGTLWWHAHSDWTRATVHGAIIVYPKNGTKYPFPKPNAEIPIILGQWWKSDVNAVRDEGLATGADPNASDSLLINGQPGTFKLTVDHGKTYLLRIINAALHEALFFSIAKHKMTVVGTDEANQHPDHYYMVAKTYSIAPVAQNFYDNTTTTAIVQYRGYYTPSSPPSLPHFPTYNDTNASVQVMAGLRSLADAEHPSNVPLSPSTKLIYTVSVNSFLCPNNSCAGPNGTRFSASINNISFQSPTIDILQAYYYNISGVYGDKFPSVPPLVFDFTADYLPLEYQTPENGNRSKGTLCRYNLVDSPLQSTISVPTNGWAAIRFEASNPGVWFMHCHVERHLTWGMENCVHSEKW